MAEGGSLPREAIATVQLTYSSENPILMDYIKEEPEEESESEVSNLTNKEHSPPPPTPQPLQVQYLPTTHQVWAGVSPVVGSLVPGLSPRPPFLANNSDSFGSPRAPIMTVVFAIVVMVLLMCRLWRERQIQRFTIQQTPPVHRGFDIIRIHPINCNRGPRF